jgi:hypothetical protein
MKPIKFNEILSLLFLSLFFVSFFSFNLIFFNLTNLKTIDLTAKTANNLKYIDLNETNEESSNFLFNSQGKYYKFQK